MNILDLIFEFLRLKILKFSDADSDPVSGILATLDRESGMEKIGSGIRDKHPGSATLVGSVDQIPVNP
jgi:hypothetical protein